MSGSINFAALDQELKEYRQELFTEALVMMESVAVMNLLPNIKDKLVLTSMVLGSLVKGWTKQFTPDAGTIELIPRVLHVQMGKTDVEIVPEELRATWLGMMMKPGVNQEDMPFERFILKMVGEKINEELELEGLFHGVRSVGTPTNAGELFDGFGKIVADEIAATNLTETATGVITNSNAIDAFREMWRSASPRLKRTKSRLYLSDEVYAMYCEDYQSTHGALPYNNQYEKAFVDGSGNRCQITPLPSFGGSQRMILTPQWNMVVGTDQIGDTNKVNYQRLLRVLQFALDYVFGVQMVMVNDEVVVTNDQP